MTLSLPKGVEGCEVVP